MKHLRPDHFDDDDPEVWKSDPIAEVFFFIIFILIVAIGTGFLPIR